MMQIIDCQQGEAEWYAARLGIPTASEFKTLLGIKKDAKDKLTRDLYMRKLAGELLTGDPMPITFKSDDMERGNEQEPEARDLYSLTRGVDPEIVGFIRNGNVGCSPDSLVDTDGGLEIKCALPHIQIDRLNKGELPSAYKAQVQGNLWIAEREWWDFVSHCRKLPLFIVRERRDEKYIADLKSAVDQFNEELAALVERIRSYGAPKPTTMEMLQASAKELERA